MNSITVVLVTDESVYKNVCVCVWPLHATPLGLILLDDYFKDKEALAITKNLVLVTTT